MVTDGTPSFLQPIHLTCLLNIRKWGLPCDLCTKISSLLEKKMNWDRLFIWVFCLTTCQARKMEPSETLWVCCAGLLQLLLHFQSIEVHPLSVSLCSFSSNPQINQDQAKPLGLAYFLSKPKMLTRLFFRVTKMNPLRQIAKCLRFCVKAGSSCRLVQTWTCRLMSFVLGYRGQYV